LPAASADEHYRAAHENCARILRVDANLSPENQPDEDEGGNN
jgi:hypothetical protein